MKIARDMEHVSRIHRHAYVILAGQVNGILYIINFTFHYP